MSSAKFSTKDLRNISAIHAFAGAQAESVHYPWWCCWAYAASVAGTTSPEEIWDIGRIWLQGWAKQWSNDHEKQPVCQMIQDIINHQSFSIQAGK